ncbi:MAG TPA: rhodanese-like domain-containing protein [Casimicrobiaceae bacterium]|nr:rhodanese-like domain-containing protein [Casimicrobiaceae bacterium]
MRIQVELLDLVRHGGAGDGGQLLATTGRFVPTVTSGCVVSYPPFVVGLCVFAAMSGALAAETSPPDNPAIDIHGYLRIANEAAVHRESHRLSEAEFIRMSREPGTIVLDARSRQKYDEVHVKGAINLSFPDIAIESLERALPDKNARILIYCNNNFQNAPGPFPSKLPSASLNISTYIALYDYGYRNVYELGPLIDISASRLELESGAAVR